MQREDGNDEEYCDVKSKTNLKFELARVITIPIAKPKSGQVDYTHTHTRIDTHTHTNILK